MIHVHLSRRDTLAALFAFSQRRAASAARRVMNVAFNYAAHSTLQDLRYLAKFDVLVTGGILSPDQLEVVRSHQTQLVLYVWSSGFYPNEGLDADQSWSSEVRKNSSRWLLSAEPVGGGAAAADKLAFWYDFGDPTFGAALAAHIRALLENHGYRGVFLDTLGVESLPAAVRGEFKKRYPAGHYDREQAQFITALRENLGSEAIIFTNQAYRKPDLFLRHANFDLIENSCTYITPQHTTAFRPWFRPGKEWDSIEIPMNQLVIPAARSHPDTQFVHLNFATGGPAALETAVMYCYAAAHLWNHTSFVASPGIQKPIHNNVYFSNLGDAETGSYEEDRDSEVAWRVFQNAVVALNCSDRRYDIRKLHLSLPAPRRGCIFFKKM